MLNYDISRMRRKVTFETVKSHQNKMGVNVTSPVDVATVWCGEYASTMSQTYTNLGTNINVDLVLVIRHNPNIKNNYKARYQGQQYDIVNINSDERLNAFDLITLRQTKGHVTRNSR